MSNRRRSLGRAFVAAIVLAGQLPIVARAVDLQTVVVGDVGNAANTNGTGLGAVRHSYRIAKYDVTNAQYAEFLNAKASASDPYGLYNPFMASGNQGGITRSGTSSF